MLPPPLPFLLAVSLALSPGLSANAGPLPLTEVAEGVFVHQGRHEVPSPENHGDIANIGFVAGDRCVAVIDSGGSPKQGQSLLEAIRSRTSLPVCYVINTHVHPDHIYGNRAFLSPNTQFVGHYKLPRAMAQRAPYYAQKAPETLGYTLADEDFIAPDLTVTQSLALDLGGRTLTLTAHPTAHTDHDLSVFDDKTRTLWLGDLLFMGHLPVIDGSVLGWLDVINRLRQVKADRAIPGHGPITAEWPLALVSEESYLSDLVKDLREALRQGQSLEIAMASRGLQHRAEWQLFEDFHKRNVATAYAELEWEDGTP